MTRITYQDDITVEEDDSSLTLLQISLKHSVPHVHACGGHARCSTCRVMVREGMDNVLPRNPSEQRLAALKGLEANVRLACQTRVTGPVRIRRLVLDDKDVEIALAEQGETTGCEKPLAILFSDIRDFTPFSEANLPYDVVHMLNRYFLMMGEAVLQNDGYIDKYIGDGMMALFGLSGGSPRETCLTAVRAGLQMLENLAEVNRFLKQHFGVEFGTRIGIHYGVVVLGQMGHPRKMQLTAIGDAVNMASRIESAVKGTTASMLISEDVFVHIQKLVRTGIEVTAALKGKHGTYKLHEVKAITARPSLSDAALARWMRQELFGVVSPRLAPLFLRLAFHDAITYDPATRSGGANGSIRLPEELAREENRGMAVAIELLRPVQQHFTQVSWADLIALAGAVAVTRTGGPDIELPLGRKDSDTPSLPARVFSANQSLEETKVQFREMGFTFQELVALSGAHTLGKANGVPFTEDLFSFTNSYFRLLMNRQLEEKEHLLPTDRGLMSDAECSRQVELYALNEEVFFKDFTAAYRKLTLLGTGLKG